MIPLKEIPKEVLAFFDNMCEREKPLVWIATTDKGKPHLAPVCFVKPIEGNRLLVAVNFIRKTAKNIKAGSLVAAGAVAFKEGYDGYLVKGKGEVVESGPHFEEISNAVAEKTKGKRRPTAGLIIDVSEVFSLKPGTEKKRIL